jgi:transglutaminase-like putative cysteine protease
MKPGIFYCVLAAVFFLILFTGCTENGSDASGAVSDSHIQVKASADALYKSGVAEYDAGNYSAAAEYFDEARSLYESRGLSEDALAAKKKIFSSRRCVLEYSLNETEAKNDLREKVPGITEEEISDWLSHSAQKLVSGGETLYFSETTFNYLRANYEILQKMPGGIDFDYISRDVLSGRKPDGDSPYFNPVYYTGTENFVLSGDVLKDTGTVQIWLPLPVETESQTNVSVSNLSYREYIAYGPVTDGQIGYVYYEIPAEKIDGDLVITADIGFKSYEQGFYVDPDKVLPYNTTDPEYILYTQSARNIEINDNVRAKAREVVGDETNPYNQAVMIYNHIIETYPYSYVPHFSLDTIEPKTALSTHMFETGHGDCGTQSTLFSAMCRSLGIPARTIGGMQMLGKKPGNHFWAEYYIEGYGWIPCDPTAADDADWIDIDDERRAEWKEYFAHNLDNTRFVIQKDVDAKMMPAIPDDAVVFRLARQTPAVIYDDSDVDVDFASLDSYSVDLRVV